MATKKLPEYGKVLATHQCEDVLLTLRNPKQDEQQIRLNFVSGKKLILRYASVMAIVEIAQQDGNVQRLAIHHETGTDGQCSWRFQASEWETGSSVTHTSHISPEANNAERRTIFALFDWLKTRSAEHKEMYEAAKRVQANIAALLAKQGETEVLPAAPLVKPAKKPPVPAGTVLQSFEGDGFTLTLRKPNKDEQTVTLHGSAYEGASSAAGYRDGVWNPKQVEQKTHAVVDVVVAGFEPYRVFFHRSVNWNTLGSYNGLNASELMSGNAVTGGSNDHRSASYEDRATVDRLFDWMKRVGTRWAQVPPLVAKVLEERATGTTFIDKINESNAARDVVAQAQ